MQVLVVEDTQSDRLLLERIVATLGYEVRSARNGVEAQELIGRSAPDIVLVDWTMPEMSGEVLTRHIREIDARKYIYVVFVTGKHSMDAMRGAFAAGADDFLAKPVHRDELEARLRAAQRIVRLETHLRQRIAELESALRRLDVASAMKAGVIVASSSETPRPAEIPCEPPPGDLQHLPAFAAIEETMLKSLSEFLGGTFAFSEAAADSAAFDASIVMTSVGLGLEIALGFSMGRPAAEAISMQLFGSTEDDAMLKDMLGEIANTVMGAVKSSFAAGGEQLTAGIPLSGMGDVLARLTACHPWKKMRAIASGDIKFNTLVAVRERPTTEIRAKNLTEGMVLAKDVKNDNGSLLVSAGTRVTATLAERLQRIAPNVRVSIIDSAA